MFTPDQIHMLASVTVIVGAINSLGVFIIKLMVDRKNCVPPSTRQTRKG